MLIPQEIDNAKRVPSPSRNGVAPQGGFAEVSANGRASGVRVTGDGAAGDGRPSPAHEVLTGTSAAIAEVRRIVAAVADTNATVLVLGESGTGKERVAQAVHQLSRRSDRPFIPVNMAAVPHGLAESLLFGHTRGSFTSAVSDQRGLCEAADGGTLFLDEIGELELPMQPKLLRFLQEGKVHRVGATTAREVDVRIVTATNREPRDLVVSGAMREDLYFRLHVVPIRIPSLRDRREDIPELVGVFLRQFAARHGRPVTGVTSEALEFLVGYDWPGNVRQLENTLERMVIFAQSEVLRVEDVPADLQSCPLPRHASAAPGETGGAALAALTVMERTERSAVVSALHQAGGHVGDAAQILGLGQATVYRKIKNYSIPHVRKRRKRSPK